MQSNAEKCLVQKLVEFLKKISAESDSNKILNIGAGKSPVIENQLLKNEVQFVCDRIDIEDCKIIHPCVNKYFKCSVESMPQIDQNEYIAVFANYVLEHVQNIKKASKEIYRVLKPGGILIVSIPNPSALEFWVAKRTPIWFHEFIRKRKTWEAYYSYYSIKKFILMFESVGFSTIEINFYPVVGKYLHQFPILATLGNLYDKIISLMKIKILMGDVCITMVKSNRDQLD